MEVIWLGGEGRRRAGSAGGRGATNVLSKLTDGGDGRINNFKGLLVELTLVKIHSLIRLGERETFC